SMLLSASLRLLARRQFSAAAKVPLLGDPIVIPIEPIDSKIRVDEGRVPALSHELIGRLEELSLVRFSDEQAVSNLRASVAKASALMDVDVEGVLPMHTVHEWQECPLADDEPEPTIGVEKLLTNVPLHRDGYIVAPLGNVPLEDAGARLDLDRVRAIDEGGAKQAPVLKRGRRTEK
ncbi:hypothetical protein PFISCL1PPCAC_22568, partial [Pristionchus fissidentatus]